MGLVPGRGRNIWPVRLFPGHSRLVWGNGLQYVRHQACLPLQTQFLPYFHRRGSAGKPRGRQPRVKWEEAPGLGTGLEAAGPSGTDQDMYYADSSEEDAPPRMNWRQLSKHLVRMLESAGGAEGSGPGTSGAPPLPHPPPDVWRELGQRCPEAAEAARQALDTASAARYFPDRPSGVWEESTALANAALALAAGQVLVQNVSSLPPEERERLGLGPAAPLDVTAVVERLRLGAGPGLRGTPA